MNSKSEGGSDFNKIAQECSEIVNDFPKAADVKKMPSSVTAIANEKVKVEKEVVAGKKKTCTFTFSIFIVK